MKRRLPILGLALMVIATVGLVGCGGSSKTTAPPTTVTKPTGTLTIGINADPPNLDPAASTALVDRYVQYSIFDRLYTLDQHLNIVPMLASAMPKITQGGTVYTIPLRKGLKFTDGTPFNAKAVVFNLTRYMDPNSPRSSELSSIASVKAIGQYTVQITLKSPYSPLLSMFTDRSGMMGSPTAITKEGANFGQDPVGIGPFEYVSRTSGYDIVLKANPHYWQAGEPKVAKLVYMVVTDENVEVVNLQSGQLDIIDTVPSQSIATLQANAGTKVLSAPGIGYQGFFLNTTAPPFNNPDLRKAVSDAIDRATLVKVALKNVAVPGYGPFAPGTPAAGADGAVPAANIAQAKADLALGGKPNGFSFVFKTAASPINQQIAQIIQNMLAQVGIKMTIQQEQFGTLLSDCSKQNFDACALGWSGRADPDGNIYSFYYTKAGLNFAGYSNATVDSLLNQARTQSSVSQRVQTYTQVMTQIHADTPYVYLYFPNIVMGELSTVHGFQLYPDGIFRTATISVSK